MIRGHQFKETGYLGAREVVRRDTRAYLLAPALTVIALIATGELLRKADGGVAKVALTLFMAWVPDLVARCSERLLDTRAIERCTTDELKEAESVLLDTPSAWNRYHDQIILPVTCLAATYNPPLTFLVRQVGTLLLHGPDRTIHQLAVLQHHRSIVNEIYTDDDASDNAFFQVV